MKKIFSVIIILSMVFSLSEPSFAASSTWLNTGATSASWVNADNWVGGVVPGSTAATNSGDTATFNTAVGANTYGSSGTPIIIDLNRNISGINFTTSTGNYTIGSTGLNPLLLSSGGTTSILVGLTATNAIETINAPLVIEGTAGTYTFSNNSGNGSGADDGTLNIGGGITGVGAGATVLTLSGTNTNSNTISGVIGNGTATTVALTKSGAGTWVLSGTNTFTGGVTLSAGTLIASNTAALGGPTSALTLSGGTLDLATNSSVTGYNTTVSGTTTIDSDRATSGVGITQTLGTLSIGANTLNVSAGSNVTSGTAGLTFGATTLSATGATFTTSSGALLTLGAVSGAGNSFTVNGAGNTDITGIIGTTTGAVTKSGTGTLILTGANTYSGLTTISGGTLQIGNGGATGSLGTGTVTDNANLTFNLTSSPTVSNVISGTGTLTQNGTGTLTLSGSNNYNGGTTISAGTLAVANGSALGTGTVANNAALSLGTTNLSLGAAYTQSSGSTLDLTANSSSSFGGITSTGHAAVVSATSTVNVAVGGYIPNNATLNIINTGETGITGGAPNTVHNTGETLTSSYTPRISFVSSVVNNDLILTANHSTSGFASLAGNSNAKAVGNVLDNESNPSSDLTNVLNTLEFLSDAKTSAALNTLGPIVDGGVLANSTASLNNFIGASIDRTQDVLALASSGNSDSTGVSSGDESVLNGIWAKQYGSYLDQGTREGIQGYNAWNTGTTIGLDRMITDNFTLGGSSGYAFGHVNSDANSSSTNINSAQGTVYAGYQGTEHPYFIDAAGTFAENWYQSQRDINVDTINRIANADYKGQQYGTYLGGGYKFDVGNNLAITPLTSLQWTHLALGSYDETNAGDLNLDVNRQSYDILESALGASISAQEKYNWGSFTPEFHAKWLYDFINDDMSVTSSFTGGGASFNTNGASPARDAVNLGGKLSFDFKNDVSLIAGVDTEIKDNFFGVSGTVTVRYKF